MNGYFTYSRDNGKNQPSAARWFSGIDPVWHAHAKLSHFPIIRQNKHFRDARARRNPRLKMICRTKRSSMRRSASYIDRRLPFSLSFWLVLRPPCSLLRMKSRRD